MELDTSNRKYVKTLKPAAMVNGLRLLPRHQVRTFFSRHEVDHLIPHSLHLLRRFHQCHFRLRRRD